jgi:hypothetical protein
MPKKKLPRGAKKWLKENYANMSNKDVMEHLGIKKGVLARLKKELRLKKSEEFMNQAREQGRATLKEMGWPPKGYAIPNREKAWASLAERTKNRGEEWKNKISESVKKQFADEKRRVLFGLEQKTNRKVIKAPKFKLEHRCRMRKLGYIIPHGSNVAYWDSDTKRSERREKTAKKYGIRVEQWIETQ